MAVGGFNGTDPAPTLEQFQALVAAKKIHYFVGGGTAMGGRGEASTDTGGSDDAARIAAVGAGERSPPRPSAAPRSTT